MTMESKFTELTDLVDGFNADSLAYPANPDPFPSLPDGLNINEHYVDFNSTEINSLLHEQQPTNNIPIVPSILAGEPNLPSTEVSTAGGSLHSATSFNEIPNLRGESLSLDYSDSSDPLLKYISQMLMEEEMEEQPWIIPDLIALRKTEKSLYDTIGKKYPNSPEQTPEVNTNHFIDGTSSNCIGNSSEQGRNGTSHSLDPNSQNDPEGSQYHASLYAPKPRDEVMHWTMNPSSHFYINSTSGFPDYRDGFGDAFPSELLDRSTLGNSQPVLQLQFNKGLEEARKFLPASFPLTLDQENYEENLWSHSKNASRGRNIHYRDDATFDDGRANKQSALYMEDCELSEMIDKVLLGDTMGAPLSLESTSEKTSQSEDLPGPSCSRGHHEKNRIKSTADLRSLLVICAQAISASDFRTAHELLQQIRHDSTPSGDGSQRLAHYFANGLEARLAGNIDPSQIHGCSSSYRTAADKLKAYQLHFTVCPFMRFQIIFANFMILKFAATAKVLHIIDFGIKFGFQWPMVIQELSKRTEGVPKLRITGIELPQSGFRPAERIEETGRRLAKYCERFNVSFEFHAVASGSWECIRIEDLRIRSGEMVAVNCLSRLKFLYDETVEENCQRDAVLRLVRSIKPDVFVQGIDNGSYNAPFFLTRFREALFHISAVYDMFDATVAGDNEQRLVLENEFYGRVIMNVVACEGLLRVQRPETYRQWQVRLTRAGFKQLPLDQELMKKARAKLSVCYHKDFGLDEERNWMLLGWRGRIISGSTCWVSA